MSVSIDERITRYMAKVDPAVSGQAGHNTTFYAASILVHGFALSEQDAWPFMVEYNTRCMPPWSEHDLRRKIREARRKSSDKPRGYLFGNRTGGVLYANSQFVGESEVIPQTKPVYEPGTLQRVTEKLATPVDASFLEARSKFTCWNRSPAGALHKLFRKSEKVLIFDAYKSQGACIWEHGGSIQDLSTLNSFQKGCADGAWFMANPVDGKWNDLDRLKSEYNRTGRSRRSEENITSWRFAVLESDHVQIDQWLKLVVQLPLPISQICTSGGDSVHALIRIDAGSKAEWEAIMRGDILPILVRLGADQAALKATQLTRLPNCMRESKGNLQRLLYLDDEPDGVPICEKSIREAPDAVYMRCSEALLFWSYDQDVHYPQIDKRIEQLEAL